MAIKKIHVVDSHTGGEPTRVIVSGGPPLGRGALSERLARFRDQFDNYRSAVVNEPRGNDAIVGALLCEPEDPASAAGVIYFNNVAYLGMCGHGTIGIMVTLAHLGKVKPGTYQLETPCGNVAATLHDEAHVTVRNVPSYRLKKQASVNVPGIGEVRGDVAWGGNWFFLVENHGQEIALSNLERLTDYTWRIRQALRPNGVTGANGAEIDHIELFAPSSLPGVNSKNFVLCPGRAYDRSPCGTGTSAKMACLYADGKLKPGEVWRQESLVGSVFEGSIEIADGMDGAVIPSIKGSAYINAEADLLLDEHDPFCMGIRA